MQLPSGDFIDKEAAQAAVMATAEALLRGERGAEQRLRALLQNGYRQAGLSPVWYCKLGLHCSASGLSAVTPVPVQVQVLIRRLGHWMLYALAVASGHQRDARSCQRWLDAISSEHRGFRTWTYQKFLRAAKALDLDLETLAQAQSAPDGRSKQPVSSEEWQRRAHWNRLLAAGNFDALLLLSEEQMTTGQHPTNHDLSMLLRAVRVRADRDRLAVVVSHSEASIGQADAVLVQELLCAYRVLGWRERAERLFAEATKRGMVPNRRHYTTLIALCADHDDRLSTERYADALQSSGLPLDVIAQRAIRDARVRCTRRRLTQVGQDMAPARWPEVAARD